MKYTARIEQITTKTYGKVVEIDADSELQAREKAEDIAMEANSEKIEADWDVWDDSDWTSNVAEVELCE